MDPMIAFESEISTVKEKLSLMLTDGDCEGDRLFSGDMLGDGEGVSIETVTDNRSCGGFRL